LAYTIVYTLIKEVAMSDYVATEDVREFLVEGGHEEFELANNFNAMCEETIALCEKYELEIKEDE